MQNEISVDTNMDNVPSDMSWDDLVYLKDETVKVLLGQQQLLVELAGCNIDTINTNVPLSEAVNGLMQSYKDIAVEVKKTMLRHLSFDNDTITVIKTGIVNKDNDDYLEYISIAGEYIGAQELIGNLASTAYLDIFAQLKVSNLDLDKLRDAVTEGTELIKTGIKDTADEHNK